MSEYLLVGSDTYLWTLDGSGTFSQISCSKAVVAAAVKPDGTIVGVGETNGALWTWDILHASWTRQTDPSTQGAVIGVAVQSDGSFVGVGTTNCLYTLASDFTGNWTEITVKGNSACSVEAVTVQSNGTIVGVGLSGKYSGCLFTWDNENGGWTQQTTQSDGQVIALTVMPDDSFVGIGTVNALYTLPKSFSGSWTKLGVQPTGTVIGVAVLPPTITLNTAG